MSIVRIGNYVAQKTRIIGTKCDVYRAREPGSVMNTHGSITTIGGIWFGEVPTRTLPEELNELRGAERTIAIDAWRKGIEAEAYAVITEAFPEVNIGSKASRSNGTIENYEENGK